MSPPPPPLPLSQADPKTRIKEEEADVGIILSPQRRSFGTGCHVTTSTSQKRQSSPIDDVRDRLVKKKGKLLPNNKL